MKKILIFSLAFLYANFIFSQNKIKRVEPTNWWVGMQHNDIQIMVYGDKIAELTPKISSKEMVLQQTIHVPNPNYVFLNVHIPANAKPATVNIEFLRNGKTVERHPFQILKRKRSADEIVGFDASDAIYLITPDRFVNGDPSNDNVAGMREKVNRQNKGGRHGGDIKGMINSLDYIKDLGFTAIWLNPLLENDMEVYSYHGYSTTDYYKVDPRFGTNADYQNLAEVARSKGIKLIMDMIVNHCGSFHWWMEDMPSDDWINQWENMTYTNHRKTLLQDPYAAEVDKKVFTDGWFVETMPDLNQRNPLMATYLLQNSIWWVEFLGLSGIRMDTYPYPDMDYMAAWVNGMMKEYPDLNIVGEEWFEHPTIVSYWQKGKNNPNGYQSNLRSVMDFPIQMSMSKALNENEGWKTGWIGMYEMMAQDFLYPDPMNLVVFPDNHDMSRIFSQMNEDYDLYKMAISFVATTRGIPQYYYGTEILMKNGPKADHGIIRSDFPGGWKGDAKNAFTREGLTTQQKDAQNFITKLLRWRKTATAIHNGKLTHFLPKDGFYVYFRYNDTQKVMVVLNKNEKATALDLGHFSEIIGGNSMGVDVLSSKNYPLRKSIMVEGKSALILEIK